jgi:hypothetical protein
VITESAGTVQTSEVLQSLPGSTTMESMVSGTLEVVILGPAMVPVNPQLPELTGQTTVISSTTYILVSMATTVPVVLPAAQQIKSSTGEKTPSSSVSRLDFRWDIVT